MASAQKMLLEGVSDAVCFVLGALAGYGLGQAVGLAGPTDGQPQGAGVGQYHR